MSDKAKAMKERLQKKLEQLKLSKMTPEEIQEEKNRNLPFVSICTPTYNRRPFYEMTIACFNHQTYPKSRMEWIIIDDGTDKIKDLVEHIEQVKYFPYDEKMLIGKKRNIMHKKASGDILIYMDDDDYYPPERVEHAVETLMNNPKVLCAGSSEMNLYYGDIGKIYKFGPYAASHATAGTFAFKKQLLKQTSYDDTAAKAEEKHFLKNYTIPFIQLDPLKTILVFSHDHNTFDKKQFIREPLGKYVSLTNKTLESIIKEDNIRDFVLNKIGNELKNYYKE
jgi:glycosyltransferase involved in cell wall biosynthesis